MEIRGAGELLGEGQSGQMQEIGFSMYTELLERAVEALKDGREPELDISSAHGTEIDLQVAALIPDDYLPDVHSRMVLYKRISNAKDTEELKELQVEIIDRFGLLPEPVKTLFAVTELKLKVSALGVRKIELGEEGGRITFTEQPNIEPIKLIQLIQSQPDRYKLDGKERLRIIQKLPTVDERIQTFEKLLQHLSPDC